MKKVLAAAVLSLSLVVSAAMFSPAVAQQLINGYRVFANVAAGSVTTPSSGWTAMYTDSTSKKLCTKDDSGTITCMSGGSGGGATFLITPPGTTGTSAGTVTANVHNLTSFVAPLSISNATKIYYKVSTADNTANNYDLGVADGSGNILCRTGALAGTTFAPNTTGLKSQTFTSSCQLSVTQGTRYYVDITTNCSSACAAIGGSGSVITQFNGNTGTTSGGALANFTPPADSPATTAVAVVALSQ